MAIQYHGRTQRYTAHVTSAPMTILGVVNGNFLVHYVTCYIPALAWMASDEPSPSPIRKYFLIEGLASYEVLHT